MHTFLTPDPVTLEIRNAAGDVSISLDDVTTTTVEVTTSRNQAFGFLDRMLRTNWSGNGPEPESLDPVDQVRVAEQDGTVIVDTDPARHGWRSGFDIRVVAPRHSGLRVQTQSADVQVHGESSRLDVRTASGGVTAGDIIGGALAHTASGDIRLGRVGSDLEARSASGDVTVAGVGGTATVQSTSGDVRIQEAAGSVSARTVSGDIRVEDATRGAVEATAVSGDVQIGVHAGSAATVSLQTLSGDTATDFDVTDEPPSVDDAPQLDIRVKTTSGDILLRRAAAVGHSL